LSCFSREELGTAVTFHRQQRVRLGLIEPIHDHRAILLDARLAVAHAIERFQANSQDHEAGVVVDPEFGHQLTPAGPRFGGQFARRTREGIFQSAHSVSNTRRRAAVRRPMSRRDRRPLTAW